MQRLLVGGMIALGCHLLLFIVPIQIHPVNRLRLPKPIGISVGFSRRTPKVVPKKERFIPSSKPILPLKERIEAPPPALRRKSTSKPRSTPKPRPLRKTVTPVASTTRRKPTLRKPDPPPLKKKPIAARQKFLSSTAPADTLSDVPEFFPHLTLSSEGKAMERRPPSDMPVAKGKESGQISPWNRRACPESEGNSPPPYPILARRRGWQGTVQLTVWVLENGQVGDITIEKSSGHSILDKSALKAVSRYRFVPGKQDGRPIAMRVRVPVHFRLKDTD